MGKSKKFRRWKKSTAPHQCRYVGRNERIVPETRDAYHMTDLNNEGRNQEGFRNPHELIFTPSTSQNVQEEMRNRRQGDGIDLASRNQGDLRTVIDRIREVRNDRRRDAQSEIPYRNQSYHGEILDRNRNQSYQGEILDRNRNQSYQGEILDRNRNQSYQGGILDRNRNQSYQEGILDRNRNQSYHGEILDRNRNQSYQGEILDRNLNQSNQGGFQNRNYNQNRGFADRNQNGEESFTDRCHGYQGGFRDRTEEDEQSDLRVQDRDQRGCASRDDSMDIDVSSQYSGTHSGAELNNLTKWKESSGFQGDRKRGKKRPADAKDLDINAKRRRRSRETIHRAAQSWKTPKCSQLENLLTKEPHEILLAASNQRSDLMAALYNCGSGAHDISLKHIPVIFDLLAKVVSCTDSNEKLNSFLMAMLSTPFFKTRVPIIVNKELMEVIISKNWSVDVGLRCLKHLIEVLLACYDRIPNATFERVHLVVLGLGTVITQLEGQDDIEMEAEIKTMYQELADADKTAVNAHMTEMKERRQASEAHDNFRGYSVAPNKDDLDKSHEELYLRANVVSGKYLSVDDYLDIQFRLMREDFVSPLRKGVNALRSLDVQLRPKRNISEVYVYRNALVQYPICLETNGIAYVVSFDSSRYRRSWKRNKRLMFGSLVCFFSKDFSRALFATVAERNEKALTERGEITVKFINEDVTDDQLSEEFILIESSAFFEAYRHVLTRLKAFTDATFPFPEHIVHCNKDVQAPEYLLMNPGYQYDFKCILTEQYENVEEVPVDPLDFTQWPTKEMLGLDESQYEALKSALTRRIALIQGPPGTGKTFIGLKIAKLLLENVMKRSQLFLGPILVVCYTNHALDQFVEGIASCSDARIVRVGGRCQSEALQRFLLREIRQKFRNLGRIPPVLRRNIYDIKEKIRHLYSQIMTCSTRLQATSEHVLNFSVLEPYISKDHFQEIFGRSRMTVDTKQKMKEWLLGLSTDDFEFPPETENVLSEIVADLVAESISENCKRVARKQIGEEVVSEEGELDDEDEVERGQLFELEDEAFNEEKRRYLDDCDEKMEKDAIDQTISKLLGEDFINLEADEIELTGEHGQWQLVKPRGKALRRMAKKELQSEDTMSEEEEKMVVWPQHLRHQEKWRLYRLWRYRYRRHLMRLTMADLLKDYNAACRQLQRLQAHVDRVVMEAQDVIAMTTTGAARYGDMLNILQPKIVIVEEAAEVFESHVVAALSRGCQHLILIGDHKQLKPSPNTFVMTKDYNLDVSLFERLIRNDFHYNTLGMQHRMRPEISRLLRQENLYPELEDHHSVTCLPAVEGVTHNLFFIDHREKESRDEHIQSYYNVFEARYTVRLCRHFLMQGYLPENITVLTLYTGQLFELRKRFAKEFKSGKSVRVTVVDNYQGEENDIIILSLIRSNAQLKIGFVGIENRICVAISRARKGLFVIGNFLLFRRVSPLWANILRMAEEAGQVGHGLELCCQLHPETVTSASSVEDFDAASPEGGCLVPCGRRLSCGHVCVKICHPIDQRHENYKCRKPCSKKCKQGIHECQKLCSQYCGECKSPVEIVREECGHKIVVPCSKADENNVPCNKPCDFRLECGHYCQNICGEEHTKHCTVLVTKRVPFCGHDMRMDCGSEPKDVECHVPCNALLDCEHQCTGSCWKCCGGRLHIACSVKCTRILVCGHLCGYPCGRECPPCREKCELRCVHAACDLFCGEACIRCCEKCVNRCRHRSCKKLCHELCDVSPCDCPCDKSFRCPKCKETVLCPGLCGEECIELCRSCDAGELSEIFFGSEDDPDARFLRLQTCGHIFEVTGLDQWIHGNQNGSVNAKQCPRCKTIITMTSCNRYMNEVRRNIADMEEVKRQTDAFEETWEARKNKLVRDAELLNNLSHVTLLSKRSLFYSIFKERIDEAKFMYEVRQCENILSLLLRLEEYCKKFLTYPLREVIYGMSDEYHLYSEYFLNGLLRALIRQVTTSTLEQCSRETLRYGDMLIIMKLICTSYKKPKLLDSSMSLWQECITDQEPDSATYSTSKHNSILKKIKELEKKLGKTLGIDEKERVEILRAMDFRPGHWFKCPNGHIYAIGDCGGAVEEAKCPECAATIGGTSHALAAGNVVASEMDGAASGAWSNEMNLDLGNEHLFD